MLSFNLAVLSVAIKGRSIGNVLTLDPKVDKALDVGVPSGSAPWSSSTRTHSG